MEASSHFIYLVTTALFLLHIFFLGLNAAITNITTDRLVLLALKDRVTFDPYGVLQNWTVSSPVCTWTGVTCGSRHHRVRTLNVSYMGLIGEIPPKLGNLSFLVSLDLTSNNFSGNLPQELARLQRLRFILLARNNFTGEFPSWFANMSSLEILDMSRNSIQGIIPEGIGNLRNLNWLVMSHNQLTGSIPLNIFNISTLERVAFTNNSLSGTLPHDMCLRLPRLMGLYLSYNEIRGQIPSSVSACSQLQILSLSSNNFVGTIPPDIENLEMLEELYLGSNELTGEIPANIGKLQNLRSLTMEFNMLTGLIPSSLFNLSYLQVLSLGQNRLIGSLAEDFGNLSMLIEVYLGDNNFTGVIPQSFSELSQLEILQFPTNSLSGLMPSHIFNISTLTEVVLSENNLSGTLPLDIGYRLPNLENLLLGDNNFDGFLPNSIINCSKLKNLDLSQNNFRGPVPDSLGELRLLEIFNLQANNFINEGLSTELTFITSLTNCRHLRVLGISLNPLTGKIPLSLGNLSTTLEIIDAFNCKINGEIPNGIGNLSRLVSLDMSGNDLSGFIPTSLHVLLGLQGLSLGNNQIEGYIPNNLCNLKNLGLLNLNHNHLVGTIPECLNNISLLREIHLNSNNLNTGVPDSIWELQNLLKLDLSSNSFTGSLPPQIGNLKAMVYMNLSVNRFTNYIPDVFEGLQSLINFSLAHNQFQGSIPKSIGGMLNLVSLDISHNNFSGMIPRSFEELKQLEYFNASFNELSGEIPTGGPFINFTSQSFLSNDALCGLPKYHVSRCKEVMHRSKMKKVLLSTLIPLGVTASMFIIVWALILFRSRRKNKSQTELDTSPIANHERISYYDLLHATNGYNESNFLGEGSFGSVYKGVFRDGTILAIKVFKMHLEGALKSFDVECEVLRNLRHRNLTKVITSCSNQEFKAILLEYMPNGSLDKWLYSENCFLNFMQRLSIMIDIASALEYLHHGFSTPVIHCDLKPSNVLIDENMIAHVSDFGMAKLLCEDKSITHTRTLATMCYMAPEYGLEGTVSTRCDVYSYGIMILETFTGKKPSDPMFSGDSNIKSWIQSLVSNNTLDQVIDYKLITPEDEIHGNKIRSIASILRLALHCLADAPNERMNVKDVVVELKNIRLQFIKHWKRQDGTRSARYGNPGTS